MISPINSIKINTLNQFSRVKKDNFSVSNPLNQDVFEFSKKDTVSFQGIKLKPFNELKDYLKANDISDEMTEELIKTAKERDKLDPDILLDYLEGVHGELVADNYTVSAKEIISIYLKAGKDFLETYYDEYPKAIILSDLIDNGVIEQKEPDEFIELIKDEKLFARELAKAGATKRIANFSQKFLTTGAYTLEELHRGIDNLPNSKKRSLELARITSPRKDRRAFCEAILLDDEKYKRVISLIKDKKIFLGIACEFAKLSDDSLKKVLDFIEPYFKRAQNPSAYKDKLTDFYVTSDSVSKHGDYENTTIVSYTNEDNTRVILCQTVDDEGNIQREREEEYPDGSIVSYIDGTDFFCETKEAAFNVPSDNYRYDLDRQIRVVLDSNGGTVLLTKRSKELDGVYDITSYNLEDYPEDYDILAMVKDGSIKGGKPISRVQKDPDGSITYFENLETNGYLSERKYKINPDNTSTSYSYEIKDKNGNYILKLDRTFEKTSPNQTTTTLNGKKYIADFDDKERKITITFQDGSKRVIDILAKTENEKLYESLKGFPADILISLDKGVDEWVYCKHHSDSGVYTSLKSLTSSTDLTALAHELGHCESYDIQLFADKKLASIYEKEVKEFSKKYTSDGGRNYVSYFTSEGQEDLLVAMDEFIAETRLILTTFGNIETLSSRAQFLVWNFPETISYIASKFNLNGVKNL